MLLTCENILENKNWSIDRLSRSLGFLQGVAIERGYTTISIERDFSRPLFHKAYTNESTEIPTTIEV